MVKILLVGVLSGVLWAQAPVLTETGCDAQTTTSARCYWTASFYHDSGTDTTLTTGFTSTGSAQTITVGSTTNWKGYNDAGNPLPSTFIMGGNEFGRVIQVLDATHASVEMTFSDFGGVDITEFRYKTRDNLSITAASSVCTVTTPYPIPSWWVVGYKLRLDFARAANLGFHGWVIASLIDPTHFTFACSGVADGTYDTTNEPDVQLESNDPATVHSSGETISLLASDDFLCYGDPGGGAGVYTHASSPETSITFPHAAQDVKHWAFITAQTPGSTIHYSLMSTPRQFGPSNCASPGVHTGKTPDATLMFPSTEPSNPVAPVGVPFSTSLPSSYTDSKIVGVDCPDLQACLNTVRASAGNHELRIPTGTTITAPSGGFVLPPQTGGSLVTTIRSSALDNVLPAPGTCLPPLDPSTASPGTSPCIDNPSYSGDLATIQTGNSSSATPVFVIAPWTKASGLHIGPGLKIQANPAYSLEAHSALVDFSHAQGSGILDHPSHSSNVIIDRVYFWQKNLQNGATSAVRFQGGISNAVVDCVVENTANRTQDFGSIELDGEDTLDTGYYVANNRVLGQMPFFLGTDGWNTSDVLITRNWLHNSRSWNRENKEWTHQVTISVASASAGSTTTLTLGEPSEYGFSDYTLLNFEPVNFSGATGNWTPLNSKDFQLLDGTLTSIVCNGSSCTATVPSHGLSTGDFVWVGGLNTPPCYFEVNGHQITVDSGSTFHWTSSTTGTCAYSAAFITGPVFFPTFPAVDNSHLTILLNSTGFGALTGTVTASYGNLVNCKNLGEFKVGTRVEVSGNIFENSITNQQSAVALAITNRNNATNIDQYLFSSTISDIYVHDNWMRSFGKWLAYVGVQDNNGNIPVTRVKVSNNLGTDSSGLQCTLNSVGVESCSLDGVQVGYGTHVVYDHNTVLNGGNVTQSAPSTPPAYGELVFTNSIHNFGSIGFGALGIGPRMFQTSGTGAIPNPPFPNTMTWGRNALIGDACTAGLGCGNEDYGFQRQFYNGAASGSTNCGTSSPGPAPCTTPWASLIMSDYQKNFWPHYFSGAGFAGAVPITGASNTSPIVLTTSPLACVPAPGDRGWVSGVQGNFAANGNLVVKSATSTSITLLTPGGGAPGAYTTGGSWTPLTGACNLVGNWKLGSGSRFLSGITWAGAQNYQIDAASTGQGESIDSADVGVNISALSSAIAGCSIAGSLPGATVTQVYSRTLTASGCPGSTWTLSSGSLGSGLSLNASTGVVGGTVTGGLASYSGTISYSTANFPFTLQVEPVPVITTTSLPGVITGISYFQTLSLSGGTSPVTCALASGSLTGSGLTLSAGCVISGIAGGVGTYSFSVRPTDANSISGSAQPLTIIISPLTPVLSQGSVVVGRAPSVGSGAR